MMLSLLVTSMVGPSCWRHLWYNAACRTLPTAHPPTHSAAESTLLSQTNKYYFAELLNPVQQSCLMPRLWTLGGVSGAGIGFNWIEHGGYFGRWTPARVKLDGCWQQCTSWCSTLLAEQVVWCAAEKSETMVESGAAAMWRCAGTEGESGGSGGSGGGVEHTLCTHCANRAHTVHTSTTDTHCVVCTLCTQALTVCVMHTKHTELSAKFEKCSICRLIVDLSGECTNPGTWYAYHLTLCSIVLIIKPYCAYLSFTKTIHILLSVS